MPGGGIPIENQREKPHSCTWTLTMDLTYYALFYALGIIVFGLFVRFWLRQRRILKEQEKANKTGRKR